MRRQLTIGMAAAALCLVLVGCGGGDGVSPSAHQQLQADLEATQAQLEALQEQQEQQEQGREEVAEQSEADKRREQQIADLAAAIAALTALAVQEQEPAPTPPPDPEAEDEDEEPVVVPPTPPAPAMPTVPTAEANQRAMNLRAVFGEPAAIAMPLNGGTVSITAPRRGNLTLTRGGHRTATLSGNGLRSTTMTLTAGGDTGKTVVYTDRELTRPLLDHYAEFRVGESPQFNAVTAGLIALNTTDVIAASGVSVTHRLRSSIPAGATTTGGELVTGDTPGADTDRALTMTDDAFSGRVHGVSGQFRCAGVDGCMITATGTYYDNNPDASTTTENRLNTVTLSVPDGAALHFRPSSATATVSLCDDAVQCTAGTDAQYMVFGWWKEVPTKASGEYHFGTFAEAINGAQSAPDTNTLTATYDGTAVGMYVEQDPNDPVDTHRQGEFVADADLRVDAGTVTGTIDDFVTTPTDGSAAPRTSDRWLVRLADGGAATIENMAGASTGFWAHQFVAPHGDAAPGSDPPAVVGAFNVRIPDSVHIAGAFGAEKR